MSASLCDREGSARARYTAPEPLKRRKRQHLSRRSLTEPEIMSVKFSKLQLNGDVGVGVEEDSLSSDEGEEWAEGQGNEGHIRLILDDKGGWKGGRSRGMLGWFRSRKFRRRNPERAKLVYWWKAILASLFAFSLTVILSLMIGRLATEPHSSSSSTDTTGMGAVATDLPMCSDMAAEILERGGSGVDATITALLCVGAVHAESSGIGGGGFMLVHDVNGSVFALNFRESAPQAATFDMYQSNATLSLNGGLSVAIPGEVRGIETAHKMFGTLPWKELFQPVIEMCREGFNLTEHGEFAASQWEDVLFQNEVFRNMYFTPEGKLKKAGDLVQRPELADALEAIAEGGANAFYNGSLSQSIVDEVQGSGGILTLEDLAGYQTLLEEPIHINYNDTTIYSTPTPSGGTVLLFPLNILENYQLGPTDAPNGLTYHRMVESFKYAFALRSRLGDPNCGEECDGIRETVLAIQSNMTCESYASSIWQLISDVQTFDSAHYNPQFNVPPSDHGTTHVSVLAPDGQAVSVTSTINTYFGSKLITSTGIVLNNEMDDFSSPNITNGFGVLPSEVNFIYPGKRPLSSMSPAIAVKMEGGTSQPILVIGAAGGTQIPTAIAQAIIRVLSFNETLFSAIEAARLHHQLIPNLVSEEANFSSNISTFLEARGHETYVLPLNHFGSVVQGVHVGSHGNISAHSDSRKKGGATLVSVT